MDATVIDLCAQLYDWAHFRRTKGGVKLHLVLDHDGYLPCFAVIEPAKVQELKLAEKMSFDPGTIVVMDRGYTGFHLFKKFTKEGVFFVTRMRNDLVYGIAEEREVPKNRNVLCDQIVFLGSKKYRVDNPLRRIEVWVEETQETLIFLTNNMELGATTIAAVYRDRWQIELFFKALKQCLRVKTFVGTSANALKIQIWTALIAMLLLKYLQLRSRFAWSLSNLVALLRQQLFVYRDLWVWIDRPFQPPPPLDDIGKAQLALEF
jgi:IS4 transposase